ncbi:MAG: divalent metal cation transporter, partial [Abitibacteriaceae bacterium]|nr:divalent metal cation transporter [Abditibacteriaceae bacterium]
TATMIFGAAVVLLPRVPLVTVALLSQDVNGILLPVVLVFMLKLINEPRIMGQYVNKRSQNFFAWSTVVILTVLTLILVIKSFLPNQ